MSGPDRERSLRERIFSRDGFRCVYCGEVFPFEKLTLDHVQPRMRGGDDSPGNLVTACGPCNTRKGSRPAWSFLSDLPLERANFLRFATGVWPRHRRAVEEAVRD
ncbi:MAG: HNH endonuclease [Gemmatimonadetes bacterium]|nr:HNH endonuclease [Gemmatimonadota bacterium]